MSRISRRTMLVGSAVVGTTAVGTAIAGVRQPSNDLSALIETHKAAYETFMETMQRPHGPCNYHDASSWAEEKALLAVCGFPAVSEADRRGKASYLLEIEARGELDLREHMQAVLLSLT